MKYIIKNCPALCFPLKDNPECECNKSVFNDACKDVPDCLLKRIKKLCEQTVSHYYTENYEEEDERQFFGEANVSASILHLLEIEEYE